MSNVAASRLVSPPAVPPWAPLLCLVACLGVVWTTVAPFGVPQIWPVAGAAAALGGTGGVALQVARRRRIPVQILALAAIGVGLWRGSAALTEAPAQWVLPAQRMRIVATVDAPVETLGTTASLYAQIDRVVEPSGSDAPTGRLVATLPGLAAFRPGQSVELTGRFETVDPASAAGSRLARQGVIATTAFPQIVAIGPPEENSFAAALRELRSSIEATIQRTLPEPHATLLVGLLVGSAAGMPEGLRLALVASGTSHLVVVSGYNISLVAVTELLPKGRPSSPSLD